MWTLRINKATSGANGIARLVANRIAFRVHWDRRAFVQIAALLPLNAVHDNLRSEHDGVRIRLDDDGLRLIHHRLFTELARPWWCAHRVNLGTLRALWCQRPEGANLVAKLNHHLRLWWYTWEARLHALILNRALKERRELPYRPHVLILLATHRRDLSKCYWDWEVFFFCPSGDWRVLRRNRIFTLIEQIIRKAKRFSLE